MVTYYFGNKITRLTGANWCSSNMTCKVETRAIAAVPPTEYDMWETPGQLIFEFSEALIAQYYSGDPRNRRDIFLEVYNHVFKDYIGCSINVPLTSTSLTCASASPRNESPASTTPKYINCGGKLCRKGFINGNPTLNVDAPLYKFEADLPKFPLRLNDFGQHRTPFYKSNRPVKSL